MIRFKVGFSVLVLLFIAGCDNQPKEEFKGISLQGGKSGGITLFDDADIEKE